MSIDRVRSYCKSLPHTTETAQWGSDLVFKIGGKMFAVMGLEPGPIWLSFKTTPEEFADLLERPGIIPAPYLARAHWVALEPRDAICAQGTGAASAGLVRSGAGETAEKGPRGFSLAEKGIPAIRKAPRL